MTPLRCVVILRPTTNPRRAIRFRSAGATFEYPMSALVLGPVEVRRLLPMRQCMDLVAQALRALAVADGLNPARSS